MIRIERRLVVIFGFDSYICDSRKKNMKNNSSSTCDPSSCPNEVYVAVTRSIDKCIMIHSNQIPPLKCLSLHNLSFYAEIWSVAGTGPLTHNPALMGQYKQEPSNSEKELSIPVFNVDL